MTSSLLRPAVSLSPEESLKLAQQAPEILRKNPRAFSASPLSSLFSIPETADVWTIYENLMLACLRTGDDDAAKELLERITLRFGAKHERVLAIQGLVKEATASNHSELEKILEEYDILLAEVGTNIVSTWAEIYPYAFSTNQHLSLFSRGKWPSCVRWGRFPKPRQPLTLWLTYLQRTLKLGPS